MRLRFVGVTAWIGVALSFLTLSGVDGVALQASEHRRAQLPDRGATYVLGQQVKCRDPGEPWSVGVVTSVAPLRVRKKGYSVDFEWAEVRPLDDATEETSQAKEKLPSEPVARHAGDTRTGSAEEEQRTADLSTQERHVKEAEAAGDEAVSPDATGGRIFPGWSAEDIFKEILHVGQDVDATDRDNEVMDDSGSLDSDDSLPHHPRGGRNEEVADVHSPTARGRAYGYSVSGWPQYGESYWPGKSSMPIKSGQCNSEDLDILENGTKRLASLHNGQNWVSAGRCAARSWWGEGKGFKLEKYKHCWHDVTMISLPCSGCLGGSINYGYYHFNESCSKSCRKGLCQRVCQSCLAGYVSKLKICMGNLYDYVCKDRSWIKGKYRKHEERHYVPCGPTGCGKSKTGKRKRHKVEDMPNPDEEGISVEDLVPFINGTVAKESEQEEYLDEGDFTFGRTAKDERADLSWRDFTDDYNLEDNHDVSDDVWWLEPVCRRHEPPFPLDEEDTYATFSGPVEGESQLRRC